MNYYRIARNYFLETDERCRVWEDMGITWVLHHKDPSWKTVDPERYNQWNIEDLLPMTIKAHIVIHHTGMNHTEEAKKKMSDSKKGKYEGENNPMYGVHRYGENNPMYGVHRYGENNPMYGKQHTEESKQKMSDAHRGRDTWNKGKTGIYTEEHKKKIGEAHKGNTYTKNRHWYNNGIINIMAYECPEGFVPGRLKK